MSKLNLSRRDFLNGFALSVAAGGTFSPSELLAKDGRYPPALTGLRGSHVGSFEIAAITVNRWPHGYAYEYNELFDPPEWSKKDGPHRVGARQMGRISIVNSDASAYAYVNGAFDAAHRAVNEQLDVT